jgi:hypothetical protein
MRDCPMVIGRWLSAKNEHTLIEMGYFVNPASGEYERPSTEKGYTAIHKKGSPMRWEPPADKANWKSIY